MRSQPHRDPSPRADTNEVDALERRPPPAVEQRSPREAVLHDDEAPRRKLAFQHFPDLQIRGRAAQARNRDGGEQLAIIRHAATSFATRSRSEAATGASGGRTGPPYSPPPTASMAAFTPAGPSFPTISRSSGARRSWSFPAPARSPARNAASTCALSAAAKHATAGMPPSHPRSRAADSSEPEPTKTGHPLRCGRRGQRHRLRGGSPTGPRNEPALVGQHLTHPPDHAALLVRLEQGRLSRRARHDDAVEPRGHQPGHVVAQVDGGDLSRRAVERCGDGDEHAPERPLRHWPGVASAGVAVRGRRRTERICFSNSAGLLLAARAVSYVTTSSATRSMRCWSNVCMPYSSRASRMYPGRSPVRLSSLISSRTSPVQIRISTAATRP